jgi:hypothetical protein
MADTADSKSAPGNRVGVQVPPGAFAGRGRVHPIVGLACLAVAAFLYAVVPSVLLALLQGQRGYVLLRSVTDQFVTFTLALTMLLGATRLPRLRKAVAGTIVFTAATYGLALWFLIGYWMWTGHQFRYSFCVRRWGRRPSHAGKHTGPLLPPCDWYDDRPVRLPRAFVVANRTLVRGTIGKLLSLVDHLLAPRAPSACLASLRA